MPRRLVAPDEGSPEEVIGALDQLRDEVAFLAQEQPRYVASALWEDRLPYIEAALGDSTASPTPARDRTLRLMARELAALAPRMYGPMPPTIAAFVAQYGPADA